MESFLQEQAKGLSWREALPQHRSSRLVESQDRFGDCWSILPDCYTQKVVCGGKASIPHHQRGLGKRAFSLKGTPDTPHKCGFVLPR